MELCIANLQQQTTQWCPDAMSTSPTSRTPSLLSDIESEPHRQSFNNHEPPSNPSSHNILIHDLSFDQSEDRVSNPRTTNMGVMFSHFPRLFALNDAFVIIFLHCDIFLLYLCFFLLWNILLLIWLCDSSLVFNESFHESLE